MQNTVVMCYELYLYSLLVSPLNILFFAYTVQEEFIIQVQKSFNWMKMDVGMHHAKNRGNKESP